MHDKYTILKIIFSYIIHWNLLIFKIPNLKFKPRSIFKFSNLFKYNLLKNFNRQTWVHWGECVAKEQEIIHRRFWLVSTTFSTIFPLLIHWASIIYISLLLKGINYMIIYVKYRLSSFGLLEIALWRISLVIIFGAFVVLISKTAAPDAD